MAIDLKAINERLAKAKEEVSFWETARALFLDPRMEAISGAIVPPKQLELVSSGRKPAYGELQQMVLDILPGGDVVIDNCVTTADIVGKLEANGYLFQAKEPAIAVNGALVALEEKGLAEWIGKESRSKLWRKKIAGAENLA
jgi:hypothetical protein